MKSFSWKKLLFVFFLFAVAAVVAVAIFLYTYDFNKFKPAIAKAFKAASGRELEIAGEVTFSPGIAPGISIDDIRVRNADWGSRPDMIRIRRFEIDVAFLSLLRGVIEIRRIVLEAPDIYAEKGTTGRFNFQIEPQENTVDEDSKGSIPPVIIDKIHVIDGIFQYTDAGIDRSYRLHLAKLDAYTTEAGRKINFDISGSSQDKPFQIAGDVGQVYSAIVSGGALPMSLSFSGAGTRATINGEVADMARLTGLDFYFTASGRSMAELAELVGQTFSPDPGMFHISGNINGSVERPGLNDLDIEAGREDLLKVHLRGRIEDLLAARNADVQLSLHSQNPDALMNLLNAPVSFGGELAFSGNVTSSEANIIRLSDADFSLADTDLHVSADVDISGKKPVITAAVQSGRIDLKPLFELYDSNTEQTKQQPVKGKNASTHKRSTPVSILTAFDAFLTFQTEKIDLPDLTLTDLDSRVRLENGRLFVETSGPKLPDIEKVSGVRNLQELGAFKLTGEIALSDQAMSIERIQLEAGSRHTANVLVTGAIENIASGSGFDLDIQVSGDDAQNLGHYLARPWLLNGTYSVSGRMTGIDRSSIQFTKIHGRLQDIPFRGALDVNWGGSHVLIGTSISASKFNLRPFTLPWFDFPDPIKKVADLGPLNVTLTVKDPGGRYGISSIDLAAGRKDLAQVETVGSVDDLAGLQGIDLDLAVRVADLGNLKDLTDVSFPKGGDFSLSTTLNTPAKGRFRFNNLELVHQNNRVSGYLEYEAGRNRPMISASLNSNRLDLRTLLPTGNDGDRTVANNNEQLAEKGFMFPTWPAPPEFIRSADMNIRMATGVLVAPRFIINDFNSAVSYSNKDFIINADSSSISGVEIQRQIPYVEDLKGLELLVKGTVADDRVTVEAFNFHAGSQDVLEANLEGRAADLANQQGIDFKFMLRGQDSAYLWKILEKDIVTDGPFNISGRIYDPRRRRYDFSELSLTIGDSDLSGQLNIDMTGERPILDGRLLSRNLDLRPYLKTNSDVRLSQASAAPPIGRKEKVFPTEPFDFSALTAADLNLSYSAETFLLPRLSTQAFTVGVSLQDGNLTINPLNFDTGGGHAEGHISLKPEGTHNAVSAVLKIDNQDVGQMLERLNLDRDIEGIFNAVINIDAPAESVSAFMGGLDGAVVLSMSQGRLHNKYIYLYYAGIESALKQLTSPFTQRDDTLEVNCLVNSFEIQNGDAKYAGLLDSPQTTLVAAGDIDLKKERLDITLKSNPKGGFKIGRLGRFGFSINELTKPFKLSGTLAEPTLAVDATRTAITFGKLLGGLAFGPVGLAAVFADISLGDDDPCLKAFEVVENIVKQGR